MREASSRWIGTMRRPFRRRPARRRKSRRRVRWAVLSAALLFAVVVGLVYLSVRRDPGARKAKCYSEGIEAYREGSYRQAAGWFARFLELDPDHAASHFMLGECLYRTGERERGIREVERAHALDPDREEPVLFLARVAMEDGREDEALSLLEGGLRSRDALLLKGRLLLGRGRVREGMEALARALSEAGVRRKGEPPVEAALLLADLLRERSALAGRPEDATEARRLYGRAAAWARKAGSEDSDPARNMLLARALLGLGDPDQAQYRARAAAKGARGPERARALLLQARAYFGQGARDEAVRCAEEARKLDPSPEGVRALASVWRELGDAPRELAELRRGREEHPRDLPLRRAWALAMARQGRAGEAAASLRAAAADFRDEPAFSLLLARLQVLAGEGEAALRTLREARERFPENRSVRMKELDVRIDLLAAKEEPPGKEEWDEIGKEVDGVLRGSAAEDPAALLLSGRLLLVRGQTVRAVRRLEEAVRSDPTNLEAAVLVGLAYYRAGKFEQARERLDRALKRTDAELPGPRLALADACYRLGLNKRAAAVARRVAARDPHRTDARRLLGKILIADGAYPEAEKVFENLRAMDPKDVETAMYLGFLALATGRSEKAEDAFASARGLARTPEMKFRVARVEADYYRRARMLDRAVGVYEEFVRTNPGQVDARLGLADFLASLGRRGEARDAYRRVLAADPGNLKARRRLCEYYFEEGGDPAPVERQIAEIVRRGPDSPDLLYLRGKLELVKGEIERGVNSLRSYVAAKPDDPDGRYALGVGLYREKDYAAAVDQLEAALARVPRSPRIRQTLGQVLQAAAAAAFGSKDDSSVRDLLRKALRYDPGLRGAKLMLATSLARLGDVAGSEGYCLAVVRRNAKDVNALRLLGAVRARRGDLAGAADAYRQAAEVSPHPDYDRYLLASVYLRLRNYPAALDEARRAAAASKNPLHAADVIIAALIGSGEAKNAETYAEELRRRVPDQALSHALVGVARRARGDAAGAREAFNAALEIDGRYIWALWQIVRIDLESPAAETSPLQDVSFRYDRSPDDPDLNYLMAWLHVQQVDPEGALPFLRKAIEVNPLHRPSLVLFAKVVAEAGRPEAARSPLLAFLERNPEDPEVRFLLASSYDLAGDQELAKREYEAAVEADDRYAPALNNLAMHLIGKGGDPGKARTCAERALVVDPGNPVYLDTLGRVQLAMGNAGEAERTFKSALEGFLERQTRLELRSVESGTRGKKKVKAELDRVRRNIRETKKALERIDASGPKDGG